ncbi:complex I NDUFA9 subunit family protein [Thiohalomonas denitrificans]|uniref:NADH dehydrogenase n=1 Tax=Thiohalomonas denitrificans TaxID=415747 RepID=A0A1G5PSU3_9GAMM|nr:complex I NDUFA9 subunit family protein [Thiohalomonas denitrificans]SCZ52492.1 NADH dehydrogenase [Thiohalomonas denitrificans]
MEPQRYPHRICVFGGTGFVGSHLLRRLAADRHHLRVVTRNPERHRDLSVLPSLEMTEADISSPRGLDEALEGIDVVINLVGILNERGRDGKGFSRVHVDFPRRLVEACLSKGIPRLLHMSALGADSAYGTSHYQRTKGEGENVVHSAAGIRVTSFRPSVIFGPGDSFFNRFAELLRRTPGIFPLACPQARFAPVYVGDVAEAYARAIDNARTYGQRYELCGPHAYTLQQLVEYTAQASELKRKVVGLNDFLSRMQATLLERVPGKPFSKDNYLSMQRDNVCDGPFPEIFGITPASVESIVPTYLGKRDQRTHLIRLRSRHR